MPLKHGKSQKTISSNIREFHGGNTYAKTAAKYGKKRANAQAIAVALSTARRYALGGNLPEDEDRPVQDVTGELQQKQQEDPRWREASFLGPLARKFSREFAEENAAKGLFFPVHPNVKRQLPIDPGEKSHAASVDYAKRLLKQQNEIVDEGLDAATREHLRLLQSGAPDYMDNTSKKIYGRSGVDLDVTGVPIQEVSDQGMALLRDPRGNGKYYVRHPHIPLHQSTGLDVPPLTFDPSMPPGSAGTDPFTKEIALGGQRPEDWVKRSRYTPEDVTIHELNHILQRIDHLPGGGSPEAEITYPDAYRMMGISNPNWKNTLEFKARWDANPWRPTPETKPLFDAYEALAGEVTARNAQNRYIDPKLMHKPPVHTEDVSRIKQIIRTHEDQLARSRDAEEWSKQGIAPTELIDRLLNWTPPKKYAEGGEVEELPPDVPPQRPRIVVHANPFYSDPVKPEEEAPAPAEEPYNPWERVAPRTRASVYGRPSKPLTLDTQEFTKDLQESPGESLKSFYSSLYGVDIPEDVASMDDAGRLYDKEGNQVEAKRKSDWGRGFDLLSTGSGSAAGAVGMAGLRAAAKATVAAGEFKTGVKNVINQMKGAAAPTHAAVPIVSKAEKAKIIQPKKVLQADDGYTDVTDWEHFGDTLGTNPGGFARDPKTGLEYYLKHPVSDDAAKNEMLAAKIYQLAGAPVADVSLARATNGKLAIASKVVPGKQLSKYHGKYGDLEGLHDNVVLDAWLKNWDSVGIGPENPLGNVMWKDGKAVRIDTGGALRYRGRGELKKNPYGGDVIQDLERMLEPTSKSGQIFHGISVGDLERGAERVAKVSDKDLAELVSKFGPDDFDEQMKLYSDLVQRKNAIAKHFGIGEHAPKLFEDNPKLFEGAAPAAAAKPAAPDVASMEDEMASLLADPGSAKATDFLKSLGHPEEEIAKEAPRYGGVEGMADAAGMPKSWKPQDDIVATKVAPVPKATLEPINKKVTLAANPTLQVVDELQAVFGGALMKAAASGDLNKAQVKSAVSKLFHNANVTDPATKLWKMAEINPHSAEAVFRALSDDHKKDAGTVFNHLANVVGSSPFDKLKEVPGKYLFSHTSDPKFWQAKPSKTKPLKLKIKTAKDYTDQDVEDYYHSLDTKAEKELGMAQGLPAIQKKAGIGEVMQPYNWPNASSPEWDKYMETFDDFRKEYKPDNEYALKKILFPNAQNAPADLGFHDQLLLLKGGSQKDPTKLTNPPKGYGMFSKEKSSSLADEWEVAKKYDKGTGNISEYVVAPKKAVILDYPRIMGGYDENGAAEYSSSAIVAAINAAKHRGADMLILRHMSDSGSPNHTQYHVLDTSIMRNPRAKFHKWHLGKALPFASVPGGFIFAHGKDEDADKMKRGGGVGKLESALRIAKKYASGGPLDLMANKNDTNQFLPHTKGLLTSSVPGRTDKLPIKVKPGSYVIPADILSSSALGQGNTMAGGKMLDIGLAKHRNGPRMGMFAGMGRHGLRSGSARAKSAAPKFAQHKMKRMFAFGGEVDNAIPIIAAGGEYLVEPEVVQSIGGGDVQRGHDTLDSFVKKIRAHNIKTLKKLPGPKRS